MSTNAFSAEWSSTNISYLFGHGYRTPANTSSRLTYNVMTLDHASGWKYGDNFFFTDIINVHSNSTLYTEWSPRLSSHKIFGLSYGDVIKDVLLAGQINVPSGSPLIQLYGVGLSLNVPHFNFFDINFYVRDDRNIEGSTYQVTAVWNLSLELYGKYIFTGFIDYAGSEGTGLSKTTENVLAQPQLLWTPMDNLGLGIEYLYWKNKFGIRDLNESVPQLLAKWTL